MPRPEYQNNIPPQNNAVNPPNYPINFAPMPYPVLSAPSSEASNIQINQSTNNVNKPLLPYPNLEMMPHNYNTLDSSQPPVYSDAVRKVEENTPFLIKN